MRSIAHTPSMNPFYHNYITHFFRKKVRGIHISAAVGSTAQSKKFQIYRWNPDLPNEKPSMQEYSVDLSKYVDFFLHYI
jgi:hypothetical protein